MFAEDLHGLLDTVGIDPVHLVGISLGGCLAYQFAVDFPESIKTLTIVNSIPSLDSVSDVMRKSFETRVEIIQKYGMRHMGEVLSESFFLNSEQANLRELMIERWAENDPQAYIESFRSVLDWSVADYLSSIHTPTLIISSDQDTTPLELKQTYASSMPDAEVVVIPNAHHFLPIEKPNEFNVALLDFLSNHN
jgi:pimeloyl-ACP methyl ester carboxylesterase